MSRNLRIALLAAMLLILGAVGTVAALRTPDVSAERAPLADDPATEDAEDADEEPGVVEAADLAHAADRLGANGIAVDDAQLADLAARYGVGGAVRVLAWSSETGVSVDEITAMRDGDGTTPGLGWGRIAKELGAHPGIGSIMGNRGGIDEAADD